MALLKFYEAAYLRRQYRFEANKIYQDVQENIAVKYCDVQGIAERLDEVPEGEEALPNPAADMPETAAAPTPEPEPEPEPEAEEEATPEPEEAAPTYEVKHRGGPWYDVVDTLTGEAVNETALKSDDAKALLNELEDGATTDESASGASDS